MIVSCSKINNTSSSLDLGIPHQHTLLLPLLTAVDIKDPNLLTPLSTGLKALTLCRILCVRLRIRPISNSNGVLSRTWILTKLSRVLGRLSMATLVQMLAHLLEMSSLHLDVASAHQSLEPRGTHMVREALGTGPLVFRNAPAAKRHRAPSGEKDQVAKRSFAMRKFTATIPTITHTDDHCFMT